MRNLILSISQETDDGKRRSTIAELMKEKTSLDDVAEAAKFVHLWDTTLIQVGGDFQNEARARALRMPPAPVVEADGGDEDKPAEPREKSKDELQLWALIDMMIQSKTLIKKAIE